MKNVLVQIYAAVVLVILVGLFGYATWDLSRIKTRAYEAARPAASELAAAIIRGRISQETYPEELLAVRLVAGKSSETLFRRPGFSGIAESVMSGDLRFPLAGDNTGRTLELRFRLLSPAEIIPVLRILLLAGCGVLLSTGMLIAFTPKTAQPLLLTYSAAEQPGSGDESPVAAAPDAGVSIGDGLISREHLPDRLESELRRAASFDQDLSLTLISFFGLSSPGKEDFCYAVTRFFVFRDLCFRYAGDSICIILPNQSLDAAIRTVKDFDRHLKQKIPGGSLAAGVSSRGGRLLDAGTLLREAEEALDKSLTDPDGAVFGFRADPARYRSAIAANGG